MSLTSPFPTAAARVAENRPETLDLFSNVNGALVVDRARFGGITYQPEKDEARLTGQLKRVRECMSDSAWRTLAEISAVTGDPESSVSARLRDLRKPSFGLWTVDRRRRGPGTFEYQLRGRAL